MLGSKFDLSIRRDVFELAGGPGSGFWYPGPGVSPPRYPLADRRLLIAGFSSFLTSRHHDTAAPPRSRPPANDDIHVAVQRGQEIHLAFDGKALQLVIR
jgi:hypothetical protein